MKKIEIKKLKFKKVVITELNSNQMLTIVGGTNSAAGLDYDQTTGPKETFSVLCHIVN